MLPTRTPEEIDAALRSLSGNYALTPAQRRFPTIMLYAVNGIAAAIFVGAAWAVAETGFVLFLSGCAAAVAIETAYNLMKLRRVTEITPVYVENRWPLAFLSWRIEASELRMIDVEHGQREDSLLLLAKTGRNRRIPMLQSRRMLP